MIENFIAGGLKAKTDNLAIHGRQQFNDFGVKDIGAGIERKAHLAVQAFGTNGFDHSTQTFAIEWEQVIVDRNQGLVGVIADNLLNFGNHAWNGMVTGALPETGRGTIGALIRTPTRGEQRLLPDLIRSVN